MSLKTMKEVTRLTSITENALRYYNAKGILSPTVREETGRKQWLYDDVAVIKLKKLYLLRSIGVSLDDIKIAINQEDQLLRIIMESLDELRKEREELDLKMFIAQALLMSHGVDIFQSKENSNEMSTAIMNDVLREFFKDSMGE